MASRVARGDIRLYTISRPDKRRPVVVLTRDKSIALLTAVTVVPVTSTVRGVPSEVGLDERDGMKASCAVNLHNAVTVPLEDLGALVARLSQARMHEICKALRFALGCDDDTGG